MTEIHSSCGNDLVSFGFSNANVYQISTDSSVFAPTLSIKSWSVYVKNVFSIMKLSFLDLISSFETFPSDSINFLTI